MEAKHFWTGCLCRIGDKQLVKNVVFGIVNGKLRRGNDNDRIAFITGVKPTYKHCSGKPETASKEHNG